MKMLSIGVLPCLLLVATAHATESSPPLSLSVQSRGPNTIALTRVAPAEGKAEGRSLAGEALSARVRFTGEHLVIEFLEPLPDDTRQLVVDSNLQLDAAGAPDCAIVSGSYDVLTTLKVPADSKAETSRDEGVARASARVRIGGSGGTPPEASAPGHRRRPSRRLLG